MSQRPEFELTFVSQSTLASQASAATLDDESGSRRSTAALIPDEQIMKAHGKQQQQQAQQQQLTREEQEQQFMASYEAQVKQYRVVVQKWYCLIVMAGVAGFICMLAGIFDVLVAHDEARNGVASPPYANAYSLLIIGFTLYGMAVMSLQGSLYQEDAWTGLLAGVLWTSLFGMMFSMMLQDPTVSTRNYIQPGVAPNNTALASAFIALSEILALSFGSIVLAAYYYAEQSKLLPIEEQQGCETLFRTARYIFVPMLIFGGPIIMLFLCQGADAGSGGAAMQSHYANAAANSVPAGSMA